MNLKYSVLSNIEQSQEEGKPSFRVSRSRRSRSWGNSDVAARKSITLRDNKRPGLIKWDWRDRGNGRREKQRKKKGDSDVPAKLKEPRTWREWDNKRYPRKVRIFLSRSRKLILVKEKKDKKRKEDIRAENNAGKITYNSYIRCVYNYALINSSCI